MLVVADSSPLVVLTMIGHVEKLPRLFGQVIIPPEVSVQVHPSNRPQAVSLTSGNPTTEPR
jgi:predicted nucleic acid-binding protein